MGTAGQRRRKFRKREAGPRSGPAGPRRSLGGSRADVLWSISQVTLRLSTMDHEPPAPFPNDDRSSDFDLELASELIPEDLLSPIRELFQGINLKLPLVPDKVSELMALCGQDAPSMEQVTHLVSMDQSLAAHVLRLAGSASMAPVPEVRSLDDAVRRVGTRAIGDMAVSHLVHTTLAGTGTARIRELLGRSAVAGLYAFRIGHQIGDSATASLLPGLMHDIGRPMAIHFLTGIQAWSSHQLTDETVEYLAEELHVNLGVRLAKAWRLPLSVEVAVRYHDDHNAAPAHRTDAMIACLSEVLADWTLDPESTRDVVLPDLDVVKALGLSTEDLTAIMGNLGEVREAAAAYA